jgi:RNA polymerase sigma-70 factor (ECF subfamily)
MFVALPATAGRDLPTPICATVHRIVSRAPQLDAAQSADLQTRIRAGDARAFEQLFRAHYESLCRFAHRYVDDAGLAEDLVQDLFAHLWADRTRIELRGSGRAYLFAAVRNRALNLRKRQLVEHEWAADEAHPDVRRLHRAPPASDRALEERERDMALGAAMESLPERCRMVMRLRWEEQMSHAEIAEVMGISLKGVENQLARGLQRLRQRFLGGER